MSDDIRDMFGRVSRSYDEISDWLQGIGCDRIIVYQHDADEEVARTHVHFLVFGSSVKLDALKTRYRNLYGNIARTDWMFKKAIDNNAIKYMSKGQYEPMLNKGFDEAEVATLKSQWVDPKTNLKLEDGKFVRDVAVPGQKTKIELLEQMRSKLCGTDSTRDILKIIRKVLIDNKVVVGQYKMMDYYDSLIMYSCKEDWLNGMERKINSRQGI